MHPILNRKNLTVARLMAVLSAGLSAWPANAINTGLNETATTSGLPMNQTDVPTIVGNIIQPVLGLVGVIFLALTIYAGYLWMTAQGNEENVTKAKDILKAAVIGLIVVFASYTIASFVLTRVAASLQ